MASIQRSPVTTQDPHGWTQARWIRLVAGCVVLISLGLSLLHPYWLFLTAFVGLNLFQSAFTNWCPLIWILQRFNITES